MNVILGALFITGVPAVILFIATFYVGHRLKHPSIGVVVGTILGIGFMIAFINPVAKWCLETTNIINLDEDPLEAPPWIREYVEDHADKIDDFCFQRTPSSTVRAEFNISPEDFLEWAESQGWEPREFHKDDSGHSIWSDPDQSSNALLGIDDTVYPLRNGEGRIKKDIGHGYLISEDDQDDNSYMTVVYDIEEERVYVSKGWV